MIKRFRFGVSAAPTGAPASIRPLRTSLSTSVEADGEGFLVQWFADAGALARYQAWEAAPPAPDAYVCAEEVVQRGGDWLDRRWAGGGRRWKHVALARRAPGLTPAEFSARWRGHGGRAPTRAGGSTAIPETARGQAYAQNHPLPRADGDWPYDAITEVWFDARKDLDSRAAWFRENVTADDLFGEIRFLVLSEAVIGPEV